MVPSGSNCEQTREYISLDLDDALSELEQERLRMHLVQCPACAQYAHDITATTALLRDAPLERLSTPIALATLRRPRRRFRVGAGAGAAVAAVLALGIGVTSMGNTPSTVPVPFDDSALGDRQNWDGVQSKPIALRHAAPGRIASGTTL
jgi:predicted anti-sigma-YlaC factor YlaD